MVSDKNSRSKLSERCMSNADFCNPCDIDAEMVILDHGRTVYLHAQWIGELPKILLEATAKSVYDLYERMNRNGGNFDGIIARRNKISAEGIVGLGFATDPEALYEKRVSENLQLLL